jgi:hypothetical protein
MFSRSSPVMGNPVRGDQGDTEGQDQSRQVREQADHRQAEISDIDSGEIETGPARESHSAGDLVGRWATVAARTKAQKNPGGWGRGFSLCNIRTYTEGT